MARYAIVDKDGYNLHNHKLLKLLGVTGSKLPKEGMPERQIQGVRNFRRSDTVAEVAMVTVWVNPAPTTMRPGKYKSSAHRIMCRCPGCARELSVGRLFQHKCGAK
jgi:hypothetical protein